MAWSIPRTWTTTELVTKTICDQHIRDQFVELAHAVVVHDRDVTTTAVANTTTETTVYSKSIVGGVLSTNKAVRLSIIGDYLNNSGSDSNFRVRVKYGATTVFDSGDAAMTASANTRGFKLDFMLSALNATNAQVGSCTVVIANASSATAGHASGSDVFITLSETHAGVAEDSTAAKTLLVTLQHGTAAATITANAYIAFLEYLTVG